MYKCKGVIYTQTLKKQSDELSNELSARQSKRSINLKSLLYCNMAVFGGFMAGYTILFCLGYMASSQTTNMVNIIFAILGRNLSDFAVRLGALCVYVLGLFSFVFIKNKTKIDVRLASIILDTVAIIIIGLIPNTCHPIVAVYPASFALPFQWCAFGVIDGYVSASIFSTNNLKQFTTAIFEYLITKNKTKLSKAKAYGKSLLSFYIGVICYYCLEKCVGMYAVFGGLVFILSAILIFIAEKNKK